MRAKEINEDINDFLKPKDKNDIAIEFFNKFDMMSLASAFNNYLWKLDPEYITEENFPVIADKIREMFLNTANYVIDVNLSEMVYYGEED